MIKRHIIAALFSISTFALCAQVVVSEIQFDRTVFDFGTINFKSGLILASYRLTNNSATEFLIRDVKADCGCTVPTWPREAVKPGESAEIHVKFDPDNYAGEIDKKVEVYANFQDAITIPLHIKGIIRRPIQNNAEHLPGQFGYLYMPNNTAAFGLVPNRGDYRRSVLIINEYNRALKLKSVARKPLYIDVDFPEGKVMEAGDSIYIPIILHAGKVSDFGLINDVILFETNDIFFPAKSIEIAFELVQDFGKLSKKALRKAPRAELSASTIDLGQLSSGQKVQHKLLLSNKGKKELRILKVDSDCSCALLETGSKPLLRGESRELNVQFDALFKSGNQRKFIYLYTNDPRNPKIQIEILARVTE